MKRSCNRCNVPESICPLHSIRIFHQWNTMSPFWRTCENITTRTNKTNAFKQMSVWSLSESFLYLKFVYSATRTWVPYLPYMTMSRYVARVQPCRENSSWQSQPFRTNDSATNAGANLLKKLKDSLKQRILDNMHVTVSSTGVEETGKTTTISYKPAILSNGHINQNASYVIQRVYILIKLSWGCNSQNTRTFQTLFQGFCFKDFVGRFSWLDLTW